MPRALARAAGALPPARGLPQDPAPSRARAREEVQRQGRGVRRQQAHPAPAQERPGHGAPALTHAHGGECSAVRRWELGLGGCRGVGSQAGRTAAGASACPKAKQDAAPSAASQLALGLFQAARGGTGPEQAEGLGGSSAACARRMLNAVPPVRPRERGRCTMPSWTTSSTPRRLSASAPATRWTAPRCSR